MKGLLYDGAQYRGCGARILNQVPTATMVAETADAGPGTDTGAGLPRQTCGITGWQTLNAGRSQRGRTYWPFPASNADTAQGIPSSTYQANVGVISNILMSITNLVEGARTATVHMCLYHRKTKTSDDIIAYVVRPKWATQRRRGSYGRANPPPF